jgi:hypothetical protein
MAYFAGIIQAQEPVADDMIRFMDGLGLTNECTSEAIDQNACIMGITVIQWLVIALRLLLREKFHCAINFSGIGHDCPVTANILPFIKRSIGNYKMCVDQSSADAALVSSLVIQCFYLSLAGK